jgi:hypothetical protein
MPLFKVVFLWISIAEKSSMLQFFVGLFDTVYWKLENSIIVLCKVYFCSIMWLKVGIA